MPTDWVGEFGGTTWTRTTDPDGTPGDWYLHLFTPEQPDLNWDHPVVRAEFEDILRFWFDRGVDGIRIDSAALLIKDRDLPAVVEGRPHPFHDLDEVHEVYRAWRRISDGYPGRALIGEVWMPEVERFANYLRPDELHAAFNFDFLGCAWEPAPMRECIDRTLDAHAGDRRPGHLGAVQPRRHPARHPVRPPADHLQLRQQPRRQPGRPGARHPPGARRRPALAVTARRHLRLSGRGAGALGEREHPGRAVAGSDVDPPRAQPGRLPGAAAVERRRAAVRLLDRGAVAAAAAGVEGPHGPGPDRRPELDAGALPRPRSGCAAPSRACTGPP